ncbi:hypothetical protein N9L48_07070 [Psychrosphaera sp.]|nr:hypothetical protein [Psychrosphaera sp.]
MLRKFSAKRGSLLPSFFRYLPILCGLLALSATATNKELSNKEVNIPELPFPTSANALATIDDGEYINIFTFMGLTQVNNKLDVTSKAWKLRINKSASSIEKPPSKSITNNSSNEFWQEISPVPTEQKQKGRFATSSIVLDNKVFLLGGYSTNTVSQPKLYPNKQNITDFYSYDMTLDTYQQLADMPVPVDDTLMVSYQDRYIYVISGWHKDGAVNLVQVFDTFKNEWFQASPLLGNGRFGHAGGIVDNQMLVCDGMERLPQLASSPVMKIMQSCLLGEISPFDPTKITWIEWVHPGEQGKFRMAAFSDANQALITFIGGSKQQYDVNGYTANGKLIEPNNEIWVYHADKRSWSIKESKHAIADLKSLIKVNNTLISIGGRDKKGITNQVLAHN